MQRTKSLLVIILIAVLLSSTFGLTFTAAQDRPFEGVTVELLTFTGPQVAEPLQRRAPDFEELTGAKINVVTVPNSESDAANSLPYSIRNTDTFSQITAHDHDW